MDADGSGEIDLQEFVTACRQMGFDESEETMAKCFNEVDDDGSGNVDFDEFSTFTFLNRLFKPFIYL